MARDYAHELQAVAALQAKLQGQIDLHRQEAEQATRSSSASNDDKTAPSTLSDAQLAEQIVGLLKAQDGLLNIRPYVQAIATLHKTKRDYDAAPDAHGKLTCYHVLQEASESLPESDLKERLQSKYQTQSDEWWQASQQDARKVLTDALAKVEWPAELSDSAATSLKQPLVDTLSLHKGQKVLSPVLLPFEIMAAPVKARFLYHFSSRRATNRLDKPEWFLQHILAVLDLHYVYLQREVQGLLDEELPDHALSASHEMIRAVLPIVEDKITTSQKMLLQKPELLSHFIEETFAFDERLRLDFGFVNRDLSPWLGTTNTVLSADVFDAWLTLEQEFAETRFRELIEAEDAWEIPEAKDTMTDGAIEVRANASSRQLDDLLDGLTQRFTPVADTEQRRRFVESLPQKLLLSYHDRIQDSTEIFEVMTSGFSGGFPSADVAGKTGLQRLCRQLSGTSNVLIKLKDMAEDPYYLSIMHADGTGCLDALMNQYNNLKQRIEQLIITHLDREISAQLKVFCRIGTWSSEETPQAQIASSSQTSPQLISTFALIRELFGYLSGVCSPVLLHRLYRGVAERIDTTLYSKIVLKNNFSRRGALQLTRDLWEIWASFAHYVARPELGMRQLLDAQTVLSETAAPPEEGQASKARAKREWQTMVQVEVANRLLY
ncbi:TIP-1 family-domain-containing protein [Protomyces lactucae-debilis]|uniref:TIP-1 family-domain-containing protein n=1 Tax=Protomyces lactucae-debilis TaxID=2754530 RepID=A0A1Y2F2W8_PROLT|nr:TIP-1 family-domain-containing protein [Protomyces lactucae-debilis]ORY77686.1 TIP-1 family-domain-containing protein [Protomyces lactucae-debilis]